MKIFGRKFGKYFGCPKIFRRPKSFWTSKKCFGRLKLRSKIQIIFWISNKFVGRPKLCLDVQKIVWTSNKNVLDVPTNLWTSKQILGCPNFVLKILNETAWMYTNIRITANVLFVWFINQEFKDFKTLFGLLK